MSEYYQTDYLKGVALIQVDDNNYEKLLFYTDVSDSKFYEAFCMLKNSIVVDGFMKEKCDFYFWAFESLWRDYHIYISNDGVAQIFEGRFEDFYRMFGKYSTFEKKLLQRR